VAVVLALIFTAIGTWEPFKPSHRQANQVRGYWIVALVILVAAALVFGVILPRFVKSARAGLILAIVGLLTIAVFWTGLPTILGIAATKAGIDSAGARWNTMGAVAAAIGALTVAFAAVLAVAG
jgi:hypothetical protein